MPDSLQDDVARARALCLLRIARLETSWAALRRGESASPLISSMHRDLEALRASSSEEIGGVCDGIVRVLTFARSRAYRVPQELAELVTTGIRLSAVLVRGGAGSGRALDGFQRQVQEALREAGGDTQNGAGGILDFVRVREPGVQPAAAWWGELAVAASAAFLAHLQADGTQRARLHAAWLALAGEVATYRPPGPRTMDVLRFRATSLPVDVAVSAGWTVEPEAVAEAHADAAVDPLGACFGAPAPDTEGREPPFVLVLRRAAVTVPVVAATLAAPAVARPLCPTPETHPVEIVSVDGVEVVLVRPERFSRRSG